MHKDKQNPFFVVSRGGPALLGMTGVKRLELLIVNCNTIVQSQKDRQINEQIAQDKSSTKI